MIILSLSKVSFPESAGDNRDIRDNRGGRLSRSSPIVTGLSWRATDAEISGRRRQSGRLSRLARLSRGKGGNRVSETGAIPTGRERIAQLVEGDLVGERGRENGMRRSAPEADDPAQFGLEFAHPDFIRAKTAALAVIFDGLNLVQHRLKPWLKFSQVCPGGRCGLGVHLYFLSLGFFWFIPALDS